MGSTLQSSLANLTISRMTAGKNVNVRSSLEKRFAISCYHDNVKKE